MGYFSYKSKGPFLYFDSYTIFCTMIVFFVLNILGNINCRYIHFCLTSDLNRCVFEFIEMYMGYVIRF